MVAKLLSDGTVGNVGRLLIRNKTSLRQNKKFFNVKCQ